MLIEKEPVMLLPLMRAADRTEPVDDLGRGSAFIVTCEDCGHRGEAHVLGRSAMPWFEARIDALLHENNCPGAQKIFSQ